MLASMAERKQYRGNHAANIILFYEYNMQKSKMLHLKGRIFEEFSAFLYIKAVWRIEKLMGLRIGNRTQFHILL